MPFPLPAESVRALLECYLRAKDLNRPALIADCFAADAELSFSLARDDIDFPARVAGAPAIAHTLVGDFGERFERCRTYYVCMEPSVDEAGVSAMPWLVAMRQKDSGALRIGHGAYRWRFASDANGIGRIAALHIHIARMDTIDDPDGAKLTALHAAFGYPWLPPQALTRGFAALAAAHPGWTFVAPFRQIAGATDA
ncbi:nuclear transport factor 2 family protein [Burkholderia pseudomultivorans]|uniref:nuclear transport factor 2 family protein n=1 Tax=Burkholderia pseudomultivorans TaxID=1207504 RepID=UPI002874FCE6|nr:nuclear transport factor 2 family protein [Burkholderia pseudomultivorans]MDS0795808.1 nuclear transport factor 2 family protein [Burkholderia pseudomultivorans]